MKSLYAYFGLIDLHDIDSPGHSLYQLGLIDSIREFFGEQKFDLYSYYPREVTQSANVASSFPNTGLGEIFTKYKDKLIETNDIELDNVLSNIAGKSYRKLYLKARFRNLSTLTKKWKDARYFEQIIDLAIECGYAKEDIIILDTDLSLPSSFVEAFSEFVTILIPSIHFPGISKSFLDDCVAENLRTFDRKSKDIVFYGNIDTSSYKDGNSKNENLVDTLKAVSSFCEKHDSSLTLICKNSDALLVDDASHIPRNLRETIWHVLERSSIMLNITKDKYNEAQFIPARIYEAMIFGLIPVSYKFNFLSETFSYSNPVDLEEILKYLYECNPSDMKIAYQKFIQSYLNRHINHFIP